MATHQALPSLGFSRQEHCSRLPFPSPMHQSESEVAQSCLTLHDPMDCSLPGSSSHGIFQARVLEWGAIAFSILYSHKTPKLPVTPVANETLKWSPISSYYSLIPFSSVQSLSRVRLLATPWTAAYQAPPAMGFSRQEYWSGLPLPSLRRRTLVVSYLK